MKNKRFFGVMIFSFLLITLSACGGGGGSTPAIPTSRIVVTPSIGLINGADVKVTKPDGTQLGTTVKTDATGKATITFSGYSGPIIVEVAGNATATYFDEALGTNAAFATGERLRTALDSVKSEVGVTPLTEIAVQCAEAIAGSTASFTTTAIQTANETIRQALASEIADITAPPQLVSTSTTSGTLDTSDASKYAAKLAALAKMAQAKGGVTVTHPALAIAKQLAADLQDGLLDGKLNGSTPITGAATYTAASFAADLKTQIMTWATNYGNATLQSLANGGTLSIIISDLSKITITSGLSYTIAGAVSGSVLSGVTITLSGAGSATTTTNASGNYSIANLVNGSYTVTPSMAGYTFTPAISSVTVSGANITGTNFVATANTVPTYSISGVVSGAVLSSVTITLSGARSATTTTNASGNYSFANLVSGSYTVMPSMAGYNFTPASKSVTISGASITGTNFVATANTVPTYSIAGSVSGAVLSGVTITLSGTGSATTSTSAGGNYSFSILANGSYTVTPSMAGYTFSPTSSVANVSGTNITGTNFVATANIVPTYSISGAVSGAVLSGVAITLRGAGSATTPTNASGNYSFSSLANGSYNVTPSMAGYTFTPTSSSVTVSGASITSTNFVATANTVPTYSISGAVSGSVLSGVTITLSGAGSATTPTNVSGNYSFANLANGSYTVTPSLAGYTFTPASSSATVSGASVTSTNFVATATPSAGYVIEGGLTWMPISSTFYTYAQATAVCAGNINGQSGWRLPTQPELSALFDSGALNGQSWTSNLNLNSNYTWSSTSPFAGVYAIVLYIIVGDQNMDFVSYNLDTGFAYVTCVR